MKTVENLWRQQPLSDHADVDQGNTELFLLALIALIAQLEPTRLPTSRRQAEVVPVVPLGNLSIFSKKKKNILKKYNLIYNIIKKNKTELTARLLE